MNFFFNCVFFSMGNFISCGAKHKRPSGKNLSLDNYEFLSICASHYGTPRSSPGEAVLPNQALHGNSVINGIRYHPYSMHFGYPTISSPSVPTISAIPFDFAPQDELERELVLWVTTKLNSCPPATLHPWIAARVSEIINLTLEEQVVEPMRMLEQLRIDLSGTELPDPSAKRNTVYLEVGSCDVSSLLESERYVGLDFIVMDETMQRLRWKYPRVNNIFTLMEEVPKNSSTGWNYEQTGTINVWTRTEDDGSFSVRCQSVQAQPLFNAISLIYEVDLHPTFMPHLHKASRLGMLEGCGKRAQILARYIYQMPIPFANRDTVLFAFGCNAMAVEGLNAITICAQSIPGDHWWGHPVPAEGADRTVRERIRGMSFVMRPVGDGQTEMTVIANMDKQIVFIPQSLMNWMIKDMIKGLYKNMIKINLKFDKTEFAKRVDKNPQFYDWVKETLSKHNH